MFREIPVMTVIGIIRLLIKATMRHLIVVLGKVALIIVPTIMAINVPLTHPRVR